MRFIVAQRRNCNNDEAHGTCVLNIVNASRTSPSGKAQIPGIHLFCIDLTLVFMIIYFGVVLFHWKLILQIEIGGYSIMATKTNFILKVQDSKLADIQKALKDANITVVSILEIHKEEA